MSWTIDLESREVRDASGAHVVLRRRSFGVLMTLAARADHVIAKDDLIATNWPGIAVSDDSLAQCIADIRRVFGASLRGTVRTVPGRGYMLSGWYRGPGGLLSSGPVSKPAVRRGNLPRPRPLVAREGEIARLVALLDRGPLVTVAGPGGVGKTVLAIAVAEAVSSRYRDGAYFVDLSPLAPGQPIEEAVLAALGLEQAEAGLFALARAVRGMHALVLLDNCEHVIEAAAHAVLQCLQAAPALSILATSRVPLAVEGERVLRPGPLACPETAEGLSPAEALAHGAIALLVQRAEEEGHGFTLAARDVAATVAICRRLDGLPLALVLASARLGGMALEELAEHLARRGDLPDTGSRAASGRKRTLRAMIGWSVDLLSVPDRSMFAQMGVFVGPARMQDIAAVCAFSGPGADADSVLRLVDASLLNAVRGVDGRTRYFFYQTTRAYALECLDADPQAGQAARHRFAAHLVAVFARAERDAETQPLLEWRLSVLPHADALRAALDWCFATPGAETLAVALVALSGELFEELSLQAERVQWVGRALSLQEAAIRPDLLGRLKIWLSLGTSWGVGDRRLEHEAVAHLVEAGEAYWEGRARSMAMVADAAAGDFAAVHDNDRRALVLLAPHGDTRALGDFYRYRSLALTAEGRDGEARAAIARAAVIADAIGDLKGALWARDVLANQAFAAGDIEGALALQQEALRLAEALESALDVAFGLTRLAAFHLLCGDATSGRAGLVTAIDLALRLGAHEASVLHVGLSALDGWLCADADAALGLARFALDAWAKMDAPLSPIDRAVARTLRDRMAVHEGRVDAPVAVYGSLFQAASAARACLLSRR